MSADAGLTAFGDAHAAVRARYFSVVSGITLGLTLWGFSDNLVWDVKQPSNSDPKFIVHGLFCLGWMLLFCAQANLVRVGNLALHRNLGLVGIVMGAGVIISTLYVFIVVWKGWDAMAVSVKANRLLLTGFAVLWSLALLWRRRPDWHKRCMLLATLYMLGPVLSRSFNPIDPFLTQLSDAVVDGAWFAVVALSWSGLFVSLLVHDWRQSRRIHPVTLAGTLMFVVIWITVNLI